MDGDRYTAVSRLRAWRPTGDGAAALELEGGVAEIAVAADGSLRLRATADSELPADPGPAIDREPWQPARVEPEATEDGGLLFDHATPEGTCRVTIEADPFAVTLSDRKGAQVARIVDLGFAPGGGGRIAIEARPGERFFGFGETSGGLDKRGRRLRLRNRDPHLDTRGSLYVSIPFFLGLAPGGRGHPARGVFLDALAPCRFDVAASVADRVVATTDFDGIDLTVMPGPTPREVTRRFAARVGTGPLPPLWALGHHQSRWSYRNEKEVRAVAAQLRARGIPTDAIHLDIDYMDGYRVFTWHPKRFPNPRRLVSDIARQGFRVVAIIDPGVKVDRSYRVFRDGVERGVFCANEDGSPYSLRVWPGAAALPDFHREEVRAWWGEQHRELTAAGVAGVWNDMNEPAGWRSDVRIGRMIVPFRAQDTRQVVVSDPRDESRTVPFERVRNLYGQQECRATREGLEVEEPARRPFVLTRSGHAGIQRYAAVWTGDNRSRWQHLRSSIPMLTNLSLSGVSFCGADIGGFFLSCSPELYARWIQLGSLYPFARTHTMWATRRQEPWSFGERVANIARTSLQLRMRLLPYLYDLFREAERSGTPVWRPLFFEFPEDEIAPGVEDQVMIGPSLLAAPVVARGEREREVYLPPGAWFSWHDDACYIGPRSVRVAAPLERMPLFVRGGSVIPTRSSVTHVGEVPVEPWVLEVFPGADADGEFVEDDGESLAYRDGVVARSGYHLWHRAGGRLRLELRRREGAFQIEPRPVRVAIHACPRPTSVFLNGARLAERGLAPGFSYEAGCVQIRFVDDGDGHTLELDPAP